MPERAAVAAKAERAAVPERAAVAAVGQLETVLSCLESDIQVATPYAHRMRMRVAIKEATTSVGAAPGRTTPGICTSLSQLPLRWQLQLVRQA